MSVARCQSVMPQTPVSARRLMCREGFAEGGFTLHIKTASDPVFTAHSLASHRHYNNLQQAVRLTCATEWLARQQNDLAAVRHALTKYLDAGTVVECSSRRRTAIQPWLHARRRSTRRLGSPSPLPPQLRTWKRPPVLQACSSTAAQLADACRLQAHGNLD